jgi:hypothetical protein
MMLHEMHLYVLQKMQHLTFYMNKNLNDVASSLWGKAQLLVMLHRMHLYLLHCKRSRISHFT